MPERTLMAWPARSDNPYFELLYRPLARRGWAISEFTPRRALRRAPDVLHIHWPDLVLLEPRARLRFAKTAAILLVLALARLRGSALVWTVHNTVARAEQTTPWGVLYLRAVRALANGLIYLSEGQVPRPRPRAEVAVVSQPHYRGAYGASRDRAESRRRLGIGEEERVLGFFGAVRPYKELGALVDAFEGLEDARLLVAGRFFPECAGLAERLGADSRAIVRDEHVPDHEVAGLLAAMDVVVLPYRELGNSGVALTALSYDRPVLGPAGAVALEELRRSAGPGWVRLFEGPLDASALRGALNAGVPTGRPALGDFAPDRVVAATDEFLSLLAPDSERPC